MEVWHNPRCSKSRRALAEIEAAGITPVVRRYLDEPPTAAELDRVLAGLGLQPWEFARTGEPAAAEAGLPGLPTTGPDARARWLDALAAHPSLVQRPVLIAADGTVHLGRDDAGTAAALAAERATSGTA